MLQQWKSFTPTTVRVLLSVPLARKLQLRLFDTTRRIGVLSTKVVQGASQLLLFVSTAQLEVLLFSCQILFTLLLLELTMTCLATLNVLHAFQPSFQHWRHPS